MSREFDFIDWIRRQVIASPNVIVPPGDDLAVLQWQADDLLIVGVDQVLDGVHFDSSIHPPRDIGRKVMNRNLSDCAAMAALPAAAVATVALPKTRDIEYAKELFLGIKSAADAFDFPVVGGDTGSWDGKLVMTVTILARSAGVKPITRGGGGAGDYLYVTGPLGGSILGRHMTFEPRVHFARNLAQRCPVTAMIDLSDGLSRDLGHICRESRVGALLEAERIPVHEDALTLSKRDGRSALEHALHDGEDYELLFACRQQSDAGIYIGRLTDDLSIRLQTPAGAEPLAPKGWEHRL